MLHFSALLDILAKYSLLRRLFFIILTMSITANGVDSQATSEGINRATFVKQGWKAALLVAGSLACGPLTSATSTARPASATPGVASTGGANGQGRPEYTPVPESPLAQQLLGVVRNYTRSIDGSRLDDTVLSMPELDAAIARHEAGEPNGVASADIVASDIRMIDEQTFAFDLTSNSTIEHELTRINLDPLMARLLELGIDPASVFISVSNPGDITLNTIATIDFEENHVNENPGFSSAGFSGLTGHSQFGNLLDIYRHTASTVAGFIDPTATPSRHGTEIWVRRLDADLSLATPMHESITVMLRVVR